MYFDFMYGILFDGRIITQKHGIHKESIEWLL